MNEYININTELINTLFSNDKPKEERVIDITYDKLNKILLCKNISDETTDYGKEIICNIS